MDSIKSIKRFKLLIPTPSFVEWIGQSGENAASLLHVRLVYSWLTYRDRHKAGASIRAICRDLGLHPATATKTVSSLAGLIDRRNGEWVALPPPEGLFITRKTEGDCQHWSDGLAYLTLLLPRRGAVISYPATTRRFGLNHALLFSHLIGKAKKGDGVVRRFTLAGAAKLFDLDAKTVGSVIDDLLWLGLIQRVDLGRSSDITVADSLAGEQLGLFEPKVEPARKVVEPKEKQPRTAPTPYQYRDDGWDDCRRLCDGLMPQKRAEEAIAKARRLGMSPEDFEAEFRRVRAIHEENVFKGKVSKGNFGKYLNACLDNRVAILDEQERKEREEQRLREFLASPAYQQQLAEERMSAKADPLHPKFSSSMLDEAIHDRVLLDESPVVAYRTLDKLKTRLHQHVKEFVAAKKLHSQQEVDEIGNLKGKILRHALAALNGYYQQPELATPEEFERAIDEAIAKVEPALKPVFVKEGVNA